MLFFCKLQITCLYNTIHSFAHYTCTYTSLDSYRYKEQLEVNLQRASAENFLYFDLLFREIRIRKISDSLELVAVILGHHAATSLV
jgi:hypothetical protein